MTSQVCRQLSLICRKRHKITITNKNEAGKP